MAVVNKCQWRRQWWLISGSKGVSGGGGDGGSVEGKLISIKTKKKAAALVN